MPVDDVLTSSTSMYEEFLRGLDLVDGRPRSVHPILDLQPHRAGLDPPVTGD